MRILDRYLLKQFLQTFVICFVSLTGLFIVIDAFNNLDEFITISAKRGGLLPVMGEYYAYRVLYFFDRTCGILVLVSALFTLVWLARHNELTAIQAAGIPRSRVVRPLILAAVVIGALATVNREVFIPMCRDKLSRNAQDLSSTAGKRMQHRFDYQTDVLLRGDKAFADQQRIESPRFLLPNSLAAYGNQLVARDAFYEPPASDRPGGYRLVAVEQPRGLDQRRSLSLDGKPVLLTPADARWLKPGECFLVSSVSFDQLEGGVAWRQFSSTRELIAGLRNPSLDYGADVRVAAHGRIVQPLLDLTLLLLGLPLMLGRSSQNVFWSIGLCLLLVVAFVLVSLGCQYLGTINLKGFSPALASWLPLIIFVPVAAALADPLLER